MTTPLRAKYIRDLAIRGRAERTQQSYSRYVSELARYYHRSPELISYQEVADWLYYLTAPEEWPLPDSELRIPPNRARWFSMLYRKRWVLYAKCPFGGPQQVLSYLANYTHRVALSNRRIVAVDAQHQSVTFTYRDYRHGSQLKELTLSALEFIRRFSLHILPPGLVRIRHYGVLGNNRRKRDIEAARLIFIARGRAVELQPRSVADKPMCCPSCGKAGIRLVAFTDAAGVLHMIGVRPMPCDSS